MAVDALGAAAGIVGLSLLAYAVGFGMQCYSIYLNWRQSKVKNDTVRMIELLEKIERNTK